MLVHGDIRAYNTVLNYSTEHSETDQTAVGTPSSNDSGNNCEGWLIDFDFGGRHNAASYPKGYKHLLDDGDRPGREGNKITIMDDWKSLIGLILRSYTLVKKVGTEPTTDQRLATFDAIQALESYCTRSADSNESLLSNYHEPASLLRGYINLISQVYDITPGPTFKSDLSNCGLWLDENSLKASGAATGSPPKK
jgi:hypothetical protein